MTQSGQPNEELNWADPKLRAYDRLYGKMARWSLVRLREIQERIANKREQ